MTISRHAARRQRARAFTALRLLLAPAGAPIMIKPANPLDWRIDALKERIARIEAEIREHKAREPADLGQEREARQLYLAQLTGLKLVAVAALTRQLDRLVFSRGASR
jgi:hypothetical protein